MRKGFLFDLNKCVGCQACVLACQIENQGDEHERWRHVSTFNSFRHPDLPLFHFSLACNHCDNPLCLKSCPTRAFTRDAVLRTIDHNQEHCIGCRYCTWACPYDAPKFIRSKGVVEKCTLCKERLGEAKKPSCANLCPTGALDFVEIPEEEAISVPGFVDRNLKPAIKIVGLRKSRLLLPSESALSPPDSAVAEITARREEKKISLDKEWPLMMFTLIVSLLVGLAASWMLGSTTVSPLVLIGFGVISMVLSLTHLGVKSRAWRSILNVRSSWLSREIAALIVFLISLTLYSTALPTIWLSAFTLLVGIIVLVSVDMVYMVAENKPIPGMNSASTLLTGILVLSLASESAWLFVAVSLWKCVLYVREAIHLQHTGTIRRAASIVRILTGFVIPILLIVYVGNYVLAALSVAAAELIGRAEFYDRLVITTPRTQIQKEFQRQLVRS